MNNQRRHSKISRNAVERNVWNLLISCQNCSSHLLTTRYEQIPDILLRKILE